MTTSRDFLGKFESGNVKILQDMGYFVHYAANMKEQEDLYDEEKVNRLGVMVHHIDIERSPYMLRNNWKAFHQLVELVRRYNISIIHCHTPVGGVLGRLAGRYFQRDGICIIYTSHGFHFYRGAPWFNNSVYYCVEKMLAHDTDILIVINREDYESACRFRLKKGGKVFRIPGVGVDMQKFSPLTEEQRQSARQTLGIRPGQTFLISVGEINKNKNQEIILKALSLIRDRGKDMTGLFYGICGDGFFRGYIEQQIHSMGLDDNVKIFGFRKNVREILGCADVSVFPSKREGLGMAALESLSMGIPVIAADNRGTREYMKNGVNGYVCAFDDADAFADRICAVMDMTGERKCEMQKRCRMSVEMFERKKTEEQMYEIYRVADEMIMRDVRHG